MVATPVKNITLEGFLALPETKPASEYIDGKIVQKPMPQGKHSLLRMKLLIFINSILMEAKIAIAFPELRCTFGGISIIPDVVVLKNENIPALLNWCMKPVVGAIHELPLPQVLAIEKNSHHTCIQQRL